jgi:hypothetical protein
MKMKKNLITNEDENHLKGGAINDVVLREDAASSSHQKLLL